MKSFNFALYLCYHFIFHHEDESKEILDLSFAYSLRCRFRGYCRLNEDSFPMSFIVDALLWQSFDWCETSYRLVRDSIFHCMLWRLPSPSPSLRGSQQQLMVCAAVHIHDLLFAFRWVRWRLHPSASSNYCLRNCSPLRTPSSDSLSSSFNWATTASNHSGAKIVS